MCGKCIRSQYIISMYKNSERMNKNILLKRGVWDIDCLPNIQEALGPLKGVTFLFLEFSI